MNLLKHKLLLILLLELTLRLLAITARPLWYDEAFAVLFSAEGPTSMVYGTLAPDASGAAADIHPLGYYTVLWGWTNLFGTGLISIRGLSILFGLGTIALAYYLAKALFDTRTGEAAAFLVAISPFQIHYSQEVRMYALFTLLILGCAYALFRVIHAPKQAKVLRWWVLFSVLAAAAQYTHNLAVFYLIPLALVPVIARKPKAVLGVTLAGLGAAVLYLTWLVHLPGQLSKVSASYWVPQPGISRLITTLLSFSTNLPVPANWLTLALILALFIFTLTCWQTYKAYRDKAPGWRLGLWMVYLTLAPPALLFLVSQWQPVYIERVLLPSGVTLMIWLGWALTATQMPKIIRYTIFVIFMFCAGLSIHQHLAYQEFPYAPYEELGEKLSNGISPEDVIVHSNKLTILPMAYYHPDLPQEYITDLPGSGSDTLAVPTQEVLGLIASPSIDVAVGDAPQIWFVIFQKAIDEYQDLGFETHPHLTWLDTHYHREGVEIWGDLLLFSYTEKLRSSGD